MLLRYCSLYSHPESDGAALPCRDISERDAYPRPIKIPLIGVCGIGERRTGKRDAARDILRACGDRVVNRQIVQRACATDCSGQRIGND